MWVGRRCSYGWWVWPVRRLGQVAQPVLPLTPHFSHLSAYDENLPPPKPQSLQGSSGPGHAVISEQGLPLPPRPPQVSPYHTWQPVLSKVLGDPRART